MNIEKTFKHNFFQKEVISVKQIKIWRLIFNLLSLCLVIMAVISLILSIPMDSVSMVMAAVASVVFAFLSKSKSMLFYEISVDDYSRLRSHKSNSDVREYLNAVYATGRKFIIKIEYQVILNYCLHQEPYEEAITKLFEQEEPREESQHNNE